jgi:hypothetical protein
VHHVVLVVGYDCDPLWIMKLTIAMIILMQFMPPFIDIVDSVYAMLVLGKIAKVLSCVMRT